MWLLYAFLTALCVFGLDIFSKKTLKKVDIYIVTWSWQFFALPILGLGLLIDGPPAIGPDFTKAVLIVVTILIFALLLYNKALQEGHLSLSLPLLSISPVFLLITSPLILGERVSTGGLFGVFFVVIGSYVIALGSHSKGFLGPFKSLLKERGTRFMMIVAVLFSITANFDKVGVINSSPVAYVFSTNLILGNVFFFIALRKSGNFWKKLRAFWPWLLLLGTLNGLSLIFQMTAVKTAMVPYVVSIKRLSILMGAMYGLFVLKEGNVKERLIGVILMSVGAWIIALT